ncbi:MAG: DUF2779 domain-containing protein [Dehalococcoidia bacterium]
MARLLSKSKYLAGTQCSRLLWALTNRPDSIPAPDAITQHVFDQGHLVGEYAKQLFPRGIDIPHDDFMGNIHATSRLLAERRPVFEAGILSGRIYSRVDILNPVNKDEWDIIEVKASTSIKGVHIDDVAFQKYCCEQAGLKIRACKLGFLNREYVREGDIDPAALFKLEDISSRVGEAGLDIEERVSNMVNVISSRTCPEVPIGPHCIEPYECSLRCECWAFLPENSIFDLRGGKTKQFSLFDQGIMSITDIPDDVALSRQQKIQKECLMTGRVHIEREEIHRFLDRLEYPLRFLDFETIAPAIPPYDGMRPYQDLPFQFSLHIVESDESEPAHHPFLAEGKDDPRPRILSELQDLLGSQGSIIAYNAGFEESVLRELVETSPGSADWLQGILTRMVDLLFPFTNFHYYNASQKDTASLKRVLSALTGRGYEEMGIGNGMDASVAYARIAYGNATEEENARVRADLIEYCKLDTEGMIWIVDELRKLCDGPQGRLPL